jgi:hypothetical protein
MSLTDRASFCIKTASVNDWALSMKIEKNVPLPKARRDKIDVISQMANGDSVLCETYPKAMSIRDALRYRGIKYATRKTDNGWRVWRLS